MCKVTCVFLLAFSSVALPLVDAMPPDPIVFVDQDHVVYLAEHPAHRTAAVVLCIIYAFLLALAQGYRAGRMAGRKARTSVSDVLVFVQGFLCTTFLFTVGINISGIGLSSDSQCYAAIRVCVTLYISTKAALNLFLLERVYIVRAPFVKRVRDPIWVTGAVITIAGYGGIMVYQHMKPESRLSREDGICWIGIQSKAAVSFMVIDTVTTFALTVIFMWHLRRMVTLPKGWPPRHVNGTQQRKSRPDIFHLLSQDKSSKERSYHTSASRNNIRSMLIRNIIGSVLLLVDTIVNKSLFVSLDFARMGHACLLMCLTDSVLGMLITQWLTMRSAENGSTVARSAWAPDTSPSALNGSTSTRSVRSTIDSCSCDAGKPTPISNTIYNVNDTAIHLDLR